MTDDFLSRWSRRKSEAKQAAAAPLEERPSEAQGELEAAPTDDVVDPVAEAGAAAEAPAEEITAEEIAALPPVEDLTSASDIAPFLRRGVPMLLRNAALRRVWTVDPAIRDFLNDAREYAYDWNTPGGVPGLGPLEPTDDVKAMLRRIFNDPEEPPPSPATETAEAEEVAADEPPAVVDDRSSTKLEDDPPTLRRPAADVPPAAADPFFMRADVPGSEAEAAPAQEPEAAADAGPRRIRRHGGATPA